MIFGFLSEKIQVREIDSIELINSECKKIILRLSFSNIDSNIGSNLQKRDRTARDEDGFMFLAPASTSRRRAYASGMHRVNYTRCIGSTRKY